MSIKPSRNPYGYRNLLAYKKADRLQSLCAELSAHFPKEKTTVALADQMNRSARSTKQNITEGWKRNSTKEYYEFLGYALASNAELEEDFTDIWKGHHPELRGLRGLMGVRGVGDEKRASAASEGRRLTSQGGSPLNPISPITPIDPDFDIETLAFYPLDTSLPLVVQLKLRAKELNFLIESLQKSLVVKMTDDNTLPVSEKIRLEEQKEKDFDHWLREERKKLEKKGE